MNGCVGDLVVVDVIMGDSPVDSARRISDIGEANAFWLSQNLQDTKSRGKKYSVIITHMLHIGLSFFCV